MKVLLDVDGVLLNSHTYFLNKVNEEYADSIVRSAGRPLSLEDIDAWDFGSARKITGIPIIRKRDEEPLGAVDYIQEAYNQTEHNIGLVDCSAALVANYLFNHFDTEIVTANHSSSGLKKALMNHGIYTGKFRQDAKESTAGYDVLIEDNPTIKLESSQTLLLRDRPYNRNLEGGNILRFHDSLQLPGMLRMIENHGSLQGVRDGFDSGNIDLTEKSSIEGYGFKLMERTYF